MEFAQNYIESARFEFERYKTLGDRTFEQLSEDDLQWAYAATDNSIAVIVKHMVGNMRSRWTNFLTEDGEKKWRFREKEFTLPPVSKSETIVLWNSGWDCLFHALDQVSESNFNQKIKIRNEEHTLVEAINRQLAHYANHVGQIVLLGKMRKGKDWISLSIPKGGSVSFNKEKFGTDLNE
ncbi:DUF1572 domain-containing protein [Maribacter sp. MJ134]|uniref:DUF1572 family protein n=1 Tax=Maribacter sp. MJ134 TaxID=2496865 RepID=UPI000F84E3B0|nr:DUF1572 family protein [Maribacter sp. MJ134]AZQ57674.1 DUF1572 domain-containing protein [Maribacter sp. MJ134]